MSRITELFDFAAEVAEKIILGRELPKAKVVFESQTINVGNIAISADGRIFASVNPLTKPATKLVEVLNHNEAVAFPDAQFAEGEFSYIRGALGINVDKHHRLWILDMEAREFIVWDLAANVMQEHFAIDVDVLRPNSFLQDFAIDEKRRRIFIADMTMASETAKAAPAIIMIDLITGNMVRLLESHPSLCSEVEGGFDLNPIAIDPNSEWLYYGAVHSHNIYRIALKYFDDDSIESLADHVEYFAKKPYCDGIVADSLERVFVTNVEDRTLGVTSRKGYCDIAKLPDGQSWPDGLALWDGCLYATLSQLDRSAALNDGVDSMQAPFMVVMTSVVGI